MNNYIGSAVPSHNPPERSQFSRTIGGLVAAAGVTVALIVPGSTNQGLVSKQVPSFDRGPQVQLGSRQPWRPAPAGDASVTLTAATETDVAQALSFTDGPAISKTLTPAAETDAAQALSVTDGPSVSKSLTAATETDAAQALSVTDGPSISMTLTAATETDVAQALSYGGAANPPPVILRAKPSHEPAPRRQVSQLINGLAVGPTVGAPPPSVQLQGGVSLGNTLGITKQVPSFDTLEPKDQIPQCFVYLNAAPPIYNVIVPGTTNQGFKFYPVKQIPPISTERGSRIFLRLQATAEQNVSITAATETDVAQALSVTDGPSISKSLTAATETDTAQALSVTDGPSISKTLTPATETDAAQALSVTQDIVKTLTAATETDVAQGLSYTVVGGGGAKQRTLTGMGT